MEGYSFKVYQKTINFSQLDKENEWAEHDKLMMVIRCDLCEKFTPYYNNTFFCVYGGMSEFPLCKKCFYKCVNVPFFEKENKENKENY